MKTGIGGTTAILACVAWTAAQADVEQEIDVPAQDLSSALTELGRETGLLISARSDVLEDRDTSGVNGRMTPNEALTQLLAGTGLHAISIASDSAVVTQNASDPALFDLGTIILTGERVERDIFNTASSVEAFDGETVDENPQNNDLEAIFEDVANITTGTGNTAPVIRGVNSAGEISGGALGTIAGTLPRATVTLDGRNLSPNETIYGTTSVFDTEAIEVFRGPQTTSQGANAIAGAINVRTRDPIFEREAAVRVEGASDNGRAFSLMFNTPVSDSVALRFVIDHEEQDTFFRFVPGAPGAVVEGTATKVRQDVARLKLLFEPLAMPQLRSKLTINYSEFAGPQNQFLSLPLSANVVSVLGGVPSFSGETLGFVHDISYDFENGFTLRNQYQYSEARSTRSFLPGPADDFDQTIIDLSNETILEFSPDGGSFSGIAGLYYRQTEEDSPAVGAILQGDRQGYGVFGEFTQRFSDAFDLTAGLRYQANDQARFAAFTPLPGVVLPVLNFEQGFDAWLPKLAVGYQPSEDTRFALQVSRGYNPGGGAVVLTSLVPYTFEEEEVTSVELSVRHRSADGRLFLAANLFYNAYDDYQLFVGQLLPAPVPPLFSAQAGRLFNVDDVQTYGLEVSAEYQARDDLYLFGSLGLLGTDVGNLGPAVAAFTGSTNGNGNELPLAPNVTLSIGADYQVTDRLRVGGRVNYTSDYFSEITNDPGLKVGNYVLLDVNAAYEITDRAELYGYVNNIFDTQEAISLSRFGTPIGAPLGPISGGSITTPREFGFGIRATF